ncbi:UDP-glucose 4-epimerase GalE [Alkalicaulis satelles]|uniref:UDP-glucose 4-epimerase n=1 Tax=Alkalicaulis satelles TaxID=2609175 RepID=A0A5M6ZGL6_9PROT|nr:UDP-glucose 4-epimerase GalE [Alkalicaulis satelles]KAA5803450.1 UDP-glucose 4-epimerase GalE [Alkalicaulis satelles]
MTVLVTGGAGYIGAHMALALLDAGETVTVLDNLVTGFDWAVDARARFVRGDAGDSALTARLIADHGVTDIIHFAGSVVVPESVTDPLGYYANNTAASRNLIEAAHAGGVKRFIFSSTAAVYGMAGDEPVREDAPLAPLSPYGRSKLMTEWMLADLAAASDLKFGVLRYFNVAGADPQGRAGQSTAKATHLIKAACQAALGVRERLDLFGTDYPTRDGTCVRDYIHVSDLVNAHSVVLDHLRGGADSVTLNCGYGRGASVREVIDTVKAVSGVDFEVRETTRRPGDPAAIVAGAERLKSELGWTPHHDDLEEIVASAWAWEQALRRRNA